MRTFLTIFLTLLSVNSVSVVNLPKAKKFNIENHLRNSEFSIEGLQIAIHYLKLEHPEIVLKQARVETSHFKSNIFKNQKNLFGMKLPKVRKTTAIDFILADKGKVAVYAHWYDSVKDYAILVNDFHGAKCKADYYKFLVQIGYCEEGSKYIELLKKM